MLTIGEIQYANVYPIFHYLKKLNKPDYHFIKGVPSYLNKMMLEGCLDTSVLSSIVYAKNPDSFLVIPDISISSVGKVKSVLLLTDHELTSLNGKTVFVTEESGTSVILLKIILNKFYNIGVNFTNEEKAADAFMYIGDKALFSYYNNRFKYLYDLGEIWYRFTGYPFVYALWLLRKEKVNNAYQFINDLLLIKNLSKENLSVLIEKYIFEGLSAYQIIDYWEIIDYNLTNKHIEGLLLFYRYAYEMSFIKRVPMLEFTGQ
ncbi:MAG: menaquinone biosynthesis protein [Calditerrivibrio sp.]|nr:menaquinone biosynthesis protein [Calditerrivibrio sp.]